MTLGAIYLAVALPGPAETAAVENDPAWTEELKTDHVAVAIFDEGKVSGYFTARFRGLRAKEIDKYRIESMLVDALHRAIYAGGLVDARAPMSADFMALAADVEKRVNEKAGSQVVENVSLDDVVFMAHE